MKDLVEYIAKSLVDNPEAVQVTEFGDDKASMITLHVAREDLGKVIGKKGRTAKAMRTLLGASASKMNKRANLEIMEPDLPEQAQAEALASEQPTGEDVTGEEANSDESSSEASVTEATENSELS